MERASLDIRSGGFTLIELMVVVSLLAILAALAGPSMAGLIASQRVKSSASELHLALLKARSEAIKRNGNVSLTPATGTNWSSGWNVVSGTVTLDSTGARNGVAISSNPTSLASIVFRYDGRTTAASNVNFQLSATSASAPRCVSIDATGRPYVKASAC